MKNFVLFAVGVLMFMPATVQASWFDNVRQQQQVREEIRSMDILDRPSRRGHFYGNAVRRRHGR